MASGEDETHDRVSLAEELIEKLKNVKSWDEWPWQWTFDEEMMNMAWLWPHCINNSCNIHVDSDSDSDVVMMIGEEKDELGCGGGRGDFQGSS